MTDSQTVRLPQDVQANIQSGLNLLSEWGRGDKGPDALYSEDPVVLSVVKQMDDFFQTAEGYNKSRDDDGGPTEASINWLLWGGTAGQKWARRLVKKKIEKPPLTTTDIMKVDEELGLVLGFAMICKQDGEPYFDTQGDYIPEESMLAASVEFMQNSRTAKEMHVGKGKGTVVFAWPLTEDIAKAFDIKTKTTGLMIAMKPDDDDILAKFKSGEYTGFSIGGERITDEDVEDEEN